MELDRPLQVTSETPRQHAEAYLAQVTAEKEAERARGLVHRFQNARTRRGTATTPAAASGTTSSRKWRHE
jgi:hypothetical protein